MPIFFRQLSLLLLLVMLAACSNSNAVRLIYPASEAGQLPSPTAKRVVVVMFDDMRQNQNIGVKRDGTPFTASSSVTDWISRTIGDDLSKKGFQVSYALTQAEAKNSSYDYIITGITRELWLTETGATTVLANIRLAITLADKRKELFTDNMTASLEKPVMWSTNATETLLQDALKSITEPAMTKLSGLMR